MILGGVVGTPAALQEFIGTFQTVLAKHGRTYIHMKERSPLDPGEDGFHKDLTNRCLAPMAFKGRQTRTFAATLCAVNLEDYFRAYDKIPFLQQKPPEAICVDHVVTPRFVCSRKAPRASYRVKRICASTAMRRIGSWSTSCGGSRRTARRGMPRSSETSELLNRWMSLAFRRRTCWHGGGTARTTTKTFTRSRW